MKFVTMAGVAMALVTPQRNATPEGDPVRGPVLRDSESVVSVS